jgi:hypothetical protein
MPPAQRRSFGAHTITTDVAGGASWVVSCTAHSDASAFIAILELGR